MANGSFLGEIGDILTGGLQSALDLEIAERLGELNGAGQSGAPRGEVDRGMRTDDGRVIRAGQPSSLSQQLASVPPAVWIAAGVGLVVVFALLRRR